MKIYVKNLKSRLETDNPDLLRALYELYSFKVPGAEYSGAYKRRQWDGKTHFFMHPSCKESLASYENYHYPEHREDQTLRHEPKKDGKFDHACDALRFLLTNLFPMKNRHAGVIDFF